MESPSARLNSFHYKKGIWFPLITGGILQALPVLAPDCAWLVTVCSLLWPFHFLLAARRAGSKKQFWLTMAVLALTKFIRLMFVFGTGLANMLAVFVFILAISAMESVAFGVDTLFSRKDWPLSSVVFPVLFTGTVYLSTLLSLGDFTNPAASLCYIPVFAQCASLFQEYGLCFLLIWISSMAATAVDIDKARRGIYIGIIALIVIVLGVYGIVRVTKKPGKEGSIRTAFCTTYHEEFDSIGSDKSAEEQLTLVRQQLTDAVNGGAELVLFAEEHVCVTEEELSGFLDNVSSLVQSAGVPVLLPVEVDRAGEQKDINEAFLFDKNGAIVLTHVKHCLVPVIESGMYESGPEDIETADIEIGGKIRRVAVAICFDTSNPLYIGQTDPDTEILLCPCWEWFSVNREQTRTAILRAVENKVTLIKATQDGYHLAVDPYGEVLFSQSSVGSYESVTVADIPLTARDTGGAAAVLNSMSPIVTCELCCLILLIVLIAAMIFQLTDKQSYLFFACLIATLIGLSCDLLSYIFDGSDWSDLTAKLINFFAYLFVDVIMFSFVLYFRELLREKKGYFLRLAYISMLLPLIDLVFLFYAAIVDKLFTVVDGIYLAGSWDAYAGITPAVSILLVLIITVRNKNKLSLREYAAIIIYMVLSILTSLLVLFVENLDSLAYAASALSMTIIFALIQSGAIEESRLREKILKEISFLDQLTGIGNRRAYDMRLAELRESDSLTAVFCDVNRLKETNDTLGHAAGDALLTEFAGILKEHFGEEYIYRISGDEFVVLLTELPTKKAELLAEDFNNKMTKHNYIASVGYASGTGAQRFEIINRAEAGMYENKRVFHEKIGFTR